MTTPDTKPMQGLADFLRASAYHAPIMSDASAETLRQWAADVDAAQASSVTEPVGGGVVAALRELANVVSIHLGLGTIPGSYGPGLKGMAMSEWIRKALHASLEKSVVALSTHEATQREGGGTVSGAAEAVPVAIWQETTEDGTPLCDEGTFAEGPNPFDYARPLYAAPKEVGISASEAASDTEFCWLVELFLPEGNSLGSYHTGFTDLSGNSRSTPDPFKAKRYSKADAEAVAANLGHTLSGTWKAIEHGFATPPPAPQPSLPEQPHVYRDIFGNPAPDALQSVLRELDNKP